MSIYNPNNLVGSPKLDAKISDCEAANSIEDDNYLYAASATEMTGLAPTVAHNEYEAQSYEEVYPYLPPVPPIPPNSAIPVPDTPISEGIHAEYRKHVTSQSNKEK